uniref:Phospholipid-transporting ATPase n=1 Tax=Dermatophagoides pteronyssinus TaxID=6956 RepID=A0A6P6Y162_DERPT|nr:putative phospholipid-transporting ATPase C6C3.06c [Dermatophagoides pteronyssinus]
MRSRWRYFLPVTLFEQFRHFFNLFYLLVALSQLVKWFAIGPLVTYLAPLAFVVAMSLSTEFLDEFKRWRQAAVLNNEAYVALTHISETGQLKFTQLPSKRIRPGYVLRLGTNARVPCDCLLLKAYGSEGATFIRTDQLDGETDWKLRYALAVTQNREFDAWPQLDGFLQVEPPRKEIYEFEGVLALRNAAGEFDRVHLSLANTLWGNTVVAGEPVLALALFTGERMRSSLHRDKAASKVSAFALEINNMSKILCAVLLVGALMLTALAPLSRYSIIYFVRHVLLLTSILPISLKVNLDLAKFVYKYYVQHDAELAGVRVQNTNISEELGRLDILLTDKTGTLTMNKMKLTNVVCNQKIYNLNVVRLDTFAPQNPLEALLDAAESETARLHRFALCMSVCHSVFVAQNGGGAEQPVFQASSPDEMALVQWCCSVGLVLAERSRDAIALSYAQEDGRRARLALKLLDTYAFDSERKRMGVLVEFPDSGARYYVVKGADSAVLELLASSPLWIKESVEYLASQGLRTLVFGFKRVSEELFAALQAANASALESFGNLAEKKYAVADRLLDCGLEFVGATAVEDHLQRDVPQTIEALCQANIKVWMLTGDKADTALSIATSTNLKRVLLSRCSPSQKAQLVAVLTGLFPQLRVAAVGDGGNDVPMIQRAHCGFGLVGFEGKQAALSADVRLLEFRQLRALVLYHGHLCRLRSFKLSSFVIQRGLVLGVVQLFFSASFYGAPVSVFPSALLVGYATYYTMLAGFAQVFDYDVAPETIYMFPEL